MNQVLEPLFIDFVNFHFRSETVEEFFTLLKDKGIKVPLGELFLYYRTEDKAYLEGPRVLTKSEEDKIAKELECDRSEYESLLGFLMEGENPAWCLERINFLCAELSLSFSYNEEDHTSLKLSMPSLNIEEVGWANFISTLMAVDLASYLLQNPMRKIRRCKNDKCLKFFTWRGLKASFCTEDCKEKHHGEKNKEKIKKYRSNYSIKGNYIKKKDRTLTLI